MENEIKTAFELAFLPLVCAKHRINGKDFLGVAVSLMDYVRERTTDPIMLREAAKTMVYAFDDLFNYKLQDSELSDMIDLLARNGQLTRAIAHLAQEENLQWMAKNNI